MRGQAQEASCLFYFLVDVSHDYGVSSSSQWQDAAGCGIVTPSLDLDGSHDRDYRLRHGQFAQCPQGL